MILTKLRFENQQKKTSQTKKQKQALFFSLLCFQLFVDLFVTPVGFKPKPKFLYLIGFPDSFLFLLTDLWTLRLIYFDSI